MTRDDDTFRRLVEPFRPQLHAHCRRMLGSAHDADDAMQEVMLRAWRSLPSFEGRAPVRAWLYRIATNVCLTALDRRRDAAEPQDDPPDEAGAVPDGEYEAREKAGMALGILLHRLPPAQRSALLLREVLGFSARETATVLDTSTASVNSALQRARARLDADEHEPEPSVQDAVDGFMGALSRGDVESLVGIATGPALAAGRSWSYSLQPAY